MIRALVIVLLLAGCSVLPTGTDECGYVWQREDEEIPESRWTIVETSDVYLQCLFAENAQACSMRYRAEDGLMSCQIVIPKEDGATRCTSREMLLRHEGLHCRGWTHGNPLKF